MAEYRKQTIIASAIAVVIALSAGLGIYFVQGHSTSTTSLVTPPVSLGGGIGVGPAIIVGGETTNATSGLQLSALLSNDTFSPGQTIIINVTEYNTLNQANNVTAGKDWPLSGMSLGGCGTLNYPFGIEIYSGYYDSSNVSGLSNQSPLEVYPPGPYACPAMFSVASYFFAAQSSNASLGIAPSGTFPALPMTDPVNVNGTWTGSTNGGSSSYHEFSPGIYTVIAGDEWGNLIIVHFSITSD